MMTPEANIRLAIICPRPLISFGLARMFQDDKLLTIVKETSALSGLEQMIATATPDVTLIDWDLIGSGPEVGDLIRSASNSTRILFLMQTAGPRECRAALEIGARGALDLTNPPTTVRRAVLKVAKGGIWMDRNAAEAVLDYALSPSNTVAMDRRRVEWLTRREREVVEQVCRGYRNKRIAIDLGIAETTVCHHLTSIFNKLEVKDRMCLLVFAHHHSLHLVPKYEASSRPKNREALNQRRTTRTKEAQGAALNFSALPLPVSAA